MELQYIFLSLDGSAKTWYESHGTTLRTWDQFETEVLETFTSILHNERAEILLQSRIQKPNEL